MKSSSRSSMTRLGSLATAAGICDFASPLSADNWTQYRGSNHDGISTEQIRTDWTQNPPRRLWKVSLEPALSSFSIGGGKLFTQVRRRLGNDDQEYCIA